jgi:hypothetical protein
MSRGGCLFCKPCWFQVGCSRTLREAACHDAPNLALCLVQGLPRAICVLDALSIVPLLICLFQLIQPWHLHAISTGTAYRLQPLRILLASILSTPVLQALVASTIVVEDTAKPAPESPPRKSTFAVAPVSTVDLLVEDRRISNGSASSSQVRRCFMVNVRVRVASMPHHLQDRH